MSEAIHTTARADQVLDLVVAGLTRREIIKWVESKSEWRIKTRQIDRLIARAHTLLEQQAAPRREREFIKSLRRLDMLFARSLQINDFKTCLSCEKERISLLGLAAMPAHRGPMPLSRQQLEARGSWRAKFAETETPETGQNKSFVSKIVG